MRQFCYSTECRRALEQSAVVVTPVRYPRRVGRRVPEAEAIADMRAVGLEPLDPYPGARKPWPCQCMTCDKKVAPTLDNIRRGQGGCRYCAPNAPIDPEVAEAQMRSAGLRPLVPFPGVVVPWLSECVTCGAHVTPQLHSIRRGRGGCTNCAGNAPIPAVEAEAELRLAGLTPLEPYPGSVLKPWKYKCMTCARQSTTSLANVRHGGGGCRFCTKWVIPDDEAEAQMRAAGFRPLESYPGNSRKPWHCQCLVCGKESDPVLDSVRSQGTGCRHCAPNAPVDALHAEQTMRAAGFVPLKPFPGASKPWLCQCSTCGNEPSPRFEVIARGGGCRFCAEYGPDWSAPGIVYLLHHEGFGAYKVGIANQTSSRTRQFASAGWLTFRTLPVTTTEEAYRIEQAVLAPYRAARLCPYLTRAELPSGHSETIDAEAVSLLDLWAEVVAVAEKLSGSEPKASRF